MDQRGEIVWNFPGRGIHKGESPGDACIRVIILKSKNFFIKNQRNLPI